MPTKSQLMNSLVTIAVLALILQYGPAKKLILGETSFFG